MVTVLNIRNRSLWRHLGEVYTQLWTSFGWNDNNDDLLISPKNKLTAMMYTNSRFAIELMKKKLAVKQSGLSLGLRRSATNILSALGQWRHVTNADQNNTVVNKEQSAQTVREAACIAVEQHWFKRQSHSFLLWNSG